MPVCRQRSYCTNCVQSSKNDHNECSDSKRLSPRLSNRNASNPHINLLIYEIIQLHANLLKSLTDLPAVLRRTQELLLLAPKMKVRSSLRKICEHCKLVKRGKKNLVICPASPKHKQRQGLSTLSEAQLQSAAPAMAPAVGLQNLSGAKLPLLFRPVVFGDLLAMYPADDEDL